MGVKLSTSYRVFDGVLHASILPSIKQPAFFELDMIATESPLPGAMIISSTPHSDERGFFARTWCSRTFSEIGLDPEMAQASVSFNYRRGTVRGMHYQEQPFSESKLVRCTRGAIYDVIVDIRVDSPTYLKWFGIELTQDNRKGLFVPKGFAHGFQTLTDNTEVFYQISTAYVPEASRGFNHADPSIGITWPLPISVISERDTNLPKLASLP